MNHDTDHEHHEPSPPLASRLSEGFSTLDTIDGYVRKLDAGCCDPGRSPSMLRLAETVGAARTALAGLDEDHPDPSEVFERLEDAGQQVGRLQVGCCTPKRMPLYANILENLTAVQLTVNRALGTGH